MKRILLFLVVVGLLAGQASAGMYYEMDAATAADMRWMSVSGGGDTGTLLYVGTNPGTAFPADWVFGTQTTYLDNMTYAVGFSGNIADVSGDDSAIVRIGLSGSSLTALQAPGGSVTGTFPGFLLPISNDNNQIWRFQSFVEDSGNVVHTSGWTILGPDGTASLTALIPGGTNFSTILGIGFDIEWKPSLNGGSGSDDYHVSVVPIPGAVILGILGLGVVGLKLRKYA